MTKLNITPDLPYSASSLFETLQPMSKRVFGIEANFRAFLDRDRVTTKLFNSNELPKESGARRIVIQGVDAIKGFNELSKKLKVDLLHDSNYRVYGEVQRVNPSSRCLFEDEASFQQHKDAKVFIIRGVAQHEDKGEASLQKLYFFRDTYVKGVKPRIIPGLNRGRESRLLEVSRAFLII